MNGTERTEEGNGADHVQTTEETPMRGVQGGRPAQTVTSGLLLGRGSLPNDLRKDEKKKAQIYMFYLSRSKVMLATEG